MNTLASAVVVGFIWVAVLAYSWGYFRGQKSRQPKDEKFVWKCSICKYPTQFKVSSNNADTLQNMRMGHLNHFHPEQVIE